MGVRSSFSKATDTVKRAWHAAKLDVGLLAGAVSTKALVVGMTALAPGATAQSTTLGVAIGVTTVFLDRGSDFLAGYASSEILKHVITDVQQSRKQAAVSQTSAARRKPARVASNVVRMEPRRPSRARRVVRTAQQLETYENIAA